MNSIFQLPESLDALKPVDFSKPSDQMLTVELFAGTATLSAELRQAGFPILVVDKSSVRQPTVNLVELDITTPNGPAVLLQTLFSANVCYFHRAPLAAPLQEPEISLCPSTCSAYKG